MRGKCWGKKSPPFLHMAHLNSSSEAFEGASGVVRFSVFRKMSPSFVACWPCASRSKLLPHNVTCVRAVFFGEKRLPLSWRTIALGGLGGELFRLFCGPSIDGLFTVEAVCAKFYVSEKKHLPFLLRTIVTRGLVFGFACLERWVPSPRRKTSPPPFLSFDFSEGVFDSYLRG